MGRCALWNRWEQFCPSPTGYPEGKDGLWFPTPRAADDPGRVLPLWRGLRDSSFPRDRPSSRQLPAPAAVGRPLRQALPAARSPGWGAAGGPSHGR